MTEDGMKKKLISKVKGAGGDEEFVNTLIETLDKEDAGANNSKNEYFRIERWVILFSGFSTVTAALSAIDTSGWIQGVSEVIKPWIDILAVVFPAVVTGVVAYRGIKKSFETWIRHRKYSLKINLLINDYLYGSGEFKNLDEKKGYELFRDKVHDLYYKSMEEFLNNMNK